MIVGLVMSYFMARSSKPGAIIELPKGETKVYNETCYEFGNSVILMISPIEAN
jgi:hypothetical protein